MLSTPTEGLTTRRRSSSWLIRTLRPAHGSCRSIYRTPRPGSSATTCSTGSPGSSTTSPGSAKRLRDPQATVREAEAFRRLLAALDAHEIELPDEDARAALGRAADGYDHASGYARIAAVHDAHHALLAILDTAEVER